MTWILTRFRCLVCLLCGRSSSQNCFDIQVRSYEHFELPFGCFTFQFKFLNDGNLGYLKFQIIQHPEFATPIKSTQVSGFHSFCLPNCLGYFMYQRMKYFKSHEPRKYYPRCVSTLLVSSSLAQKITKFHKKPSNDMLSKFKLLKHVQSTNPVSGAPIV